MPESAARRLGIERTRPMLIGEQIRDWSVTQSEVCLFPYDDALALLSIEDFPKVEALVKCAPPKTSAIWGPHAAARPDLVRPPRTLC